MGPRRRAIPSSAGRPPPGAPGCRSSRSKASLRAFTRLAFIAPTACIIGDVTVEENASVWYNTVIRADFSPIVIRRGANVQDCAVIHVTPVSGVEVGPGATVGHLCLVHAAELGEECLVGKEHAAGRGQDRRPCHGRRRIAS